MKTDSLERLRKTLNNLIDDLRKEFLITSDTNPQKQYIYYAVKKLLSAKDLIKTI